MLRSVARTAIGAAPWGRVLTRSTRVDSHALCAHVSLCKNSAVTVPRTWQPLQHRALSTTSSSSPSASSRRSGSDARKPKPPRANAPPVKHGNATDWRSLVAEFERKIHVHGDAAKVSPQEVHAIVKACALDGRHREANSVVNQAKSLGVELFEATQAQIFALQARKGNVDAVLEVLQKHITSKSSVVESDTKLFDPLIQVLKEQNDWQNIRRAIQVMHDAKLEPPVRVFRALLVAAAKSRQKDVVIKTVQFLRKTLTDDRLDVATLTAICQALNDVGETRTVMDIYLETDTNWFTAHGTTLLFNNFVLGALRQGRMNKALEIFGVMKISETFAPDDFTFATCMLEFEKREDWDQVITFFNEMQDRELKGISEPQAINTLSCAAVVRALHNREGATKREIEQSMQVVLQRLDRVEVKHFGHCSSLLDVLIEHNYRFQAQALFKRMVQAKLIDPSWLRQNGFEVDLHSFSRGVATCAVVHAFQQLRADAVLKKMDDMRIVTGVGKRSKQFLQPVVPAEVSELLIRCFRPLIRPMQHPKNPGVLLVRTKSIREWLGGGAAIRYFE